MKIDRGHIQRDAKILIRVHDVLDHLRIPRNNGTVITVCRVAESALFIENHREEDSVHARLDQIHNMPADQFPWEAQVIRHNVSRPFLENGVARRRGELHFYAAFHQQRVPEGKILKQI